MERLTIGTDRAGAPVAVDLVKAVASILAWVGLAVIDVVLTVGAIETVYAATEVTSDFIVASAT